MNIAIGPTHHSTGLERKAAQAGEFKRYTNKHGVKINGAD
jgi:hypothetical protein